MALTQEEVVKMAEEVGEVDWSDPSVVEWLKNSIRANEDIEKKLKASFVLQQMLRDDEAMKKIAEDLTSVRSTIKALNELGK
jgi:hypothetical protein